MNAAYARHRAAFADALDPEWQDITEIDDLVKAGRATVWLAGDDTALVTTVRNPPKGPVLFGLVCVGDMARLVSDIRPAVETWARNNGCVGMAFCGRTGWPKVLAPHGFKPIQTIVLKEF